MYCKSPKILIDSRMFTVMFEAVKKAGVNRVMQVYDLYKRADFRREILDYNSGTIQVFFDFV